MKRDAVFRVLRDALAAIGFVAVAWFAIEAIQAHLWIVAIIIGAAEAILLLKVERVRMAVLLNVFNCVDFIWRLIEGEDR